MKLQITDFLKKGIKQSENSPKRSLKDHVIKIIKSYISLLLCILRLIICNLSEKKQPFQFNQHPRKKWL